jgi:hypothetical protein
MSEMAALVLDVAMPCAIQGFKRGTVSSSTMAMICIAIRKV